MQRFKQHIGFKIATLTLVFALFTPTVAKFNHIFHHKYEDCKEYKAHLHSADVECSFHKFKLTTLYTLPVFSFDFYTHEQNHANTISKYTHISEYQQLHFSLRGPPQLI